MRVKNGFVELPDRRVHRLILTLITSISSIAELHCVCCETFLKVINDLKASC